LTFFPGPTAALANRGACAGKPVDAQGVCNTSTFAPADAELTEINGHAALFGFSFRPSTKLRASFDTEQFYADNFFTRISPRHLQRYKGRINYQARDWWNVGTVINLRENRNDTADINNKQHVRSYVFTSSVAPGAAKWAVDLSYDYNDIFSQTNICFASTPPLPGTVTCAGSAPLLSGLSTYNERSHLGSGMLVLKPIARVTAGLGYTFTSSNGNTLILNPTAPTGPLSFNYHLPTASLAVKINERLIYKAGWNYYDYNEKSDPGPTLPRDFRGNAFTLALRYSM
jgi:opacity protein-like surface antigen